MIKETFGYHCHSIDSFIVGDGRLEVRCWCRCRGESDADMAFVPVEWLDEGFDCVAAYDEMKRKSEETRKEKEEREKKRREDERKSAEARSEKGNTRHASGLIRNMRVEHVHFRHILSCGVFRHVV